MSSSRVAPALRRAEVKRLLAERPALSGAVEFGASPSRICTEHPDAWGSFLVAAGHLPSESGLDLMLRGHLIRARRLLVREADLVRHLALRVDLRMTEAWIAELTAHAEWLSAMGRQGEETGAP